jgi:hypothetical protein
MTKDETPDPNDQPIEEPTAEEVDDVLSEINRLGRRLGTAVSRAWESDERKRVEDELSDGLQRAGKELHRVSEGLAGSPAVEGAKKGADSAARELRTGVLTGLRFLNRELSRALDKERGGAPSEDEILDEGEPDPAGE